MSGDEPIDHRPSWVSSADCDIPELLVVLTPVPAPLPTSIESPSLDAPGPPYHSKLAVELLPPKKANRLSQCE